MKRRYTALAAGLFALLAVPMAGRGDETRTRVETRERSSTAHVRRMSTVVGARVTLADQQSVGKIEDIWLNDNGCIEYAVIAYEEKYVVVPWTITRVDFEQRTVVIEVRKDRWTEVPTFTREQIATVNDAKSIEKVRTFFSGDSNRRERPSGSSERPAEPGERPNRNPPERKDQERKDQEERKTDRKDGTPAPKPMPQPPRRTEPQKPGEVPPPRDNR